jgi:hypothetical protein
MAQAERDRLIDGFFLAIPGYLSFADKIPHIGYTLHTNPRGDYPALSSVRDVISYTIIVDLKN